MLLDPLFIFVFDMGIMGLALATTMTQLGSAIYLTYKLATSRLANCLSRTNLKPNWRYYYALIEQSLPASSNMFLVALGSFLITSAVARFGENAVAGLGIALRIEQLVLLPTIGINIAVLSLISVNYGAKQHQRMASIAHKAIQVGTTMMIGGGILIFLLAEELLTLFTDNTAVINVGISYLYVEAIILPAYVLSFVAGAVLQGMKRPMIPMYFNIIRQLILPFSFIVIALMILNTSVTGIWWSIALATWLTAALQFVHMKRAVALTSQNASTN
jgi:putative MATE family efflux protein